MRLICGAAGRRLGSTAPASCRWLSKRPGIDCPRDSDMQQAELGDVGGGEADLDGLQRGDLIFWKGHVGIMLDGFPMLHANAHHMGVVAELLRAQSTASRAPAADRGDQAPAAQGRGADGRGRRPRRLMVAAIALTGGRESTPRNACLRLASEKGSSAAR